MPAGISIHVAVEHSAAPRFRDRPALPSCLADAEAMLGIASASGFDPQLLAGEAATAGALLGAIHAAGDRIGPDGLLVLTFAGHGGRRLDPERGGRSGFRQTWCLHDRELDEAELDDAWMRFPKGARVLVISDCCFGARIGRGATSAGARREAVSPGSVKPSIEAEVLFLSATRDNERAEEKDGHGRFTRVLLDVWNGGAFEGDYVALHKQLFDRLSPGQHPVLLALKPPSFALTRPFSI